MQLLTRNYGNNQSKFFTHFLAECALESQKCITGYMNFRFTTFTTVSSLIWGRQRSCAWRKWRWCYQPLAALPSPLTPCTWPLEPSNYTPDTFHDPGYNDVIKSHKSAGSELTESLILRWDELAWRWCACELLYQTESAVGLNWVYGCFVLQQFVAWQLVVLESLIEVSWLQILWSTVKGLTVVATHSTWFGVWGLFRISQS